ncbi:hypothetical protein BJ684DRAFT_19423 [Piptocephalis cylindrospora]|uniref:Uncharacterized protein n=1 Tax=Piptocephalis cylindrospora TaxID=1907219 RepID=A0A4P9Y582_9FUNG|nr:hypothetical protein BJ684DRAFT_19423 [Piptocephalis cylindrospora]|eukprot:RKP14156.1 hypothetical protein BJ684DRAFT_19423 [Piptocephalis cylindrospora]
MRTSTLVVTALTFCITALAATPTQNELTQNLWWNTDWRFSIHDMAHGYRRSEDGRSRARIPWPLEKVDETLPKLEEDVRKREEEKGKDAIVQYHARQLALYEPMIERGSARYNRTTNFLAERGHQLRPRRRGDLEPNFVAGGLTIVRIPGRLEELNDWDRARVKDELRHSMREIEDYTTRRNAAQERMERAKRSYSLARATLEEMLQWTPINDHMNPPHRPTGSSVERHHRSHRPSIRGRMGQERH